MHLFAVSVVLAAVASTSASHLFRREGCTERECHQEYISSVCLPKDSAGKYDLTAPCNAENLVQYECVYGAAGEDYLLQLSALTNSSAAPPEPPQFSNITQRDCICQSAVFDLDTGCAACLKAHHGEEISNVENADFERFSTTYCDAAATPTRAFFDEVYSGLEGLRLSTTPIQTDPLYSVTAVSLYYTPKSASEWVIAQATETPTGSSGSLLTASPSSSPSSSSATQRSTATPNTSTTSNALASTSPGSTSPTTTVAGPGASATRGAAIGKSQPPEQFFNALVLAIAAWLI